MKQFEEQFEARLLDLERDARAASIFVYTELTLHYFFGDFDVRDRVDPHAGFWNGVLAALQGAGFIALGRLYDRDSSDHTIYGLLKFIEDTPGLFRPEALEQRKIGAGTRADNAKSFAAGSFRADRQSFSAIRQEFEYYHGVYDDHVQPIRHGVFAHAGRLDRRARDALFTKLFIRELEKLVVFPLRLHRALWGVYVNGSPPLLESPPTIVTEVLNSLPSDSTSTWEHLHAVKNAAAFAAWMKGTPMPER